MSVEIDPELRDALDKQAIHDVCMYYCRAADRLDADLLERVFHDDATVEAWRRGIEAFVPLDNMYIKCSGPNMFTQRLDRRHMEIQFETVLDMFGADRCYYGSNFPLERLWLSYDELVTTTKEILAKRSAEEQRKFFHDTAAAF